MSNMTLKDIVDKYPIVNTEWECNYDYVGMTSRIMEVTNSNRYDTLNQYIGISGYFSRKRVDDGSDDRFNRDPWMRKFKMYNLDGIKNGIYGCSRIKGVNGGNDVWITVTTVESSKVWCMDVFER
jgi:hypothetical protein